MHPLFQNINRIEFENRFTDPDKCLEFLAEEKWKAGYICRKCGHTNFCKGKSPHARRCTKCKHEESATANTIFHRCKISLTDAFRITYLVCQNPDISTYELARQIDTRQMTCWKLKKRIMECIQSKGNLDLMEKPDLPG